MPHDYRNYAHIEGIVAEDATLTSTPEGEQVITFKVNVRENRRGPKGELLLRVSTFDVEADPKRAKVAFYLKTGTPVSIDALIRIRRVTTNGVDHMCYVLKSHRIQSRDFQGWKKLIDRAEGNEVEGEEDI